MELKCSICRVQACRSEPVCERYPSFCSSRSSEEFAPIAVFGPGESCQEVTRICRCGAVRQGLSTLSGGSFIW